MLSLSQTIGPRLAQKQRQFLGETLGEIPLYSLHRVKNLIMKEGVGGLNTEILNELIRAITRQNFAYRKESGNDWNCLTSQNLLDAFNNVREGLTKAIRDIDPQFVRMPNEGRFSVLRRLVAKRESIVGTIERWFEINYNHLLYDTAGKIPWAIVQKLQASLHLWITKRCNLFGTDIEEAILSAAEERGLTVQNAEDAWLKMGGRLFKKARD